MTKHQALPLRKAPLKASYAAVLTGIALLGGSVTALGATNSVINCQDLSDTLQALDAQAAELTIKLVDLPENDAELGLAEPVDKSGVAKSDSTVPYLYLTPRVASMLRDVFDDDASERNIEDWDMAQSVDGATKQDSISPPVAKGRKEQPSLPSLEETDSNQPKISVPRFQRPMYRTDI